MPLVFKPIQNPFKILVMICRCCIALWRILLLCAVTFASASAQNVALGLPPRPYLSTDNPSAIELGERLFFDRQLSIDGNTACVTCHNPSDAFTDRRTTGIGNTGRRGTRNVPSLINIAYAPNLFWDGRRATLEEQALDPFLNPLEQGLKDLDELIAKVRAQPIYCELFAQAYATKCQAITPTLIARSLSEYERTLSFGDSRFDRYFFQKDRQALNSSEIRGLGLFRSRAHCDTCHTIGDDGALFSDFEFHGLGISFEDTVHEIGAAATYVSSVPIETLGRNLILRDPVVSALGRFNVTKRPQDIGKFKTPSLRNVALTAPYMHAGSLAILEDALNQEIYYRVSESTRPVILTPSEKSDLLAFLRSLTSARYAEGQK